MIGGGPGTRRRRPPAEPDADASREPGPDADPETVARAICLRLLTTRSRTRAELAAALEARDVPADAAERVLDRLADVRLVDDAAFAEGWVASRQRRGIARPALATELRRRGVGAEDVDAALATTSDEDERARARELVARRMPALAHVDRRARERRLVGMLARKGYPPAVAFAVVREVLGDDATDADGEAVTGSLDP